MRFFIAIILGQLLFSDPFYYGVWETKKLRLFSILHTKANINGAWVSLNEKFVHGNENFRLLELQDSCVILENVESQIKQKLCREKPKFIKERGRE